MNLFRRDAAKISSADRLKEFRDELLPIRRAQIEILANLDDVFGEAIQKIKAHDVYQRVRASRFTLRLAMAIGAGAATCLIGNFSFGWHPEFFGEPLDGWIRLAVAMSLLLFALAGVQLAASVARGDYGKSGETLRALAANVAQEHRLRRRFKRVGSDHLEQAAAAVEEHIHQAKEFGKRVPSLADAAAGTILRRLREATDRTRDSTISNLIFGSTVSIATLIIVGGLSVMTFGPMIAPTFFPHARTLRADELAALVTLKVLLTLSGQGLGFFYLMSYRKGQAETKYFVNELTSVETSLLSVHLAFEKARAAQESGVPEHAVSRHLFRAAAKAIEHLACLERNHILKRGETTTLAIERQADARELSHLMQLLRSQPR